MKKIPRSPLWQNNQLQKMPLIPNEDKGLFKLLIEIRGFDPGQRCGRITAYCAQSPRRNSTLIGRDLSSRATSASISLTPPTSVLATVTITSPSRSPARAAASVGSLDPNTPTSGRSSFFWAAVNSPRVRPSDAQHASGRGLGVGGGRTAISALGFELGHRDGQIALTAPPKHGQAAAVTRPGVADDARQVGRFFNLTAIEAQDDVARLQARLGSGRVRFHAVDQRPPRLTKANRLGHILAHLTDLHADAPRG